MNRAPLPLRLARLTRHIPHLKGLTALLKVYQRVLSPESTFRVDDFDGTLKMDVNLRETIGINIWHAPNWYERVERKMFCGAIQPGSVVLDVGANIGIYTLLAAKRGATVFSIEADPSNAKYLRHHISLNGLDHRVTVFEMAATERVCQVKLYQNPHNSGGSSIFGSGNSVTVQGNTIDSLNLPSIDLCKMDIEGAEELAIRGMSSTIGRSPKLQFLVEYARGRSEGMLRLLRSYFSKITLVGGPAVGPAGISRRYGNLWASNEPK